MSTVRDRLLEAVPPPTSPSLPPKGWGAVTKVNAGVQFSEEFRWWADTYGTGRLGDGLLWVSPRSSYFKGLYTQWAERFLTEETPFPIFPGPGTRLLAVAAGEVGSKVVFVEVGDGTVSDDRLWVGEPGGGWTSSVGPVTRVVADLVTDGIEAPGRSWRMDPAFEPVLLGGKDRSKSLVPWGEFAENRVTGPALEQLRTMMRPPRRKVAPAQTWEAAEEALGAALPEDYKAFIDTYTGGDVHGTFRVDDIRIDHIFEHLTPTAQEWDGNGGVPLLIPGVDQDRSRLLRVLTGGSTSGCLVIEEGVVRDDVIMVHERNGSWVEVPGPVTSLLMALLADTELWGPAKWTPFEPWYPQNER